MPLLCVLKVEELQRTKPAKTSIAEAGMPAFALNTKFIDNLDQPFKNFASKLKDHKLIDAFNAPAASRGAEPGLRICLEAPVDLSPRHSHCHGCLRICRYGSIAAGGVASFASGLEGQCSHKICWAGPICRPLPHPCCKRRALGSMG
jgi:hypothetical protein